MLIAGHSPVCSRVCFTCIELVNTLTSVFCFLYMYNYIPIGFLVGLVLVRLVTTMPNVTNANTVVWSVTCCSVKLADCCLKHNTPSLNSWLLGCMCPAARNAEWLAFAVVEEREAVLSLLLSVLHLRNSREHSVRFEGGGGEMCNAWWSVNISRKRPKNACQRTCDRMSLLSFDLSYTLYSDTLNYTHPIGVRACVADPLFHM